MSENTSPKRQVLDLDELLGQTPALKVHWGGKEYELLHIRALSPEALAQFLRLQRSLTTPSANASTDDDPEYFLRVSQAQDEMLRIVAPVLSEQDLSFMQKVQVLSFYADQVGEDYGLGGVSRRQQKSPTGGKSSQR